MNFIKATITAAIILLYATHAFCQDDALVVDMNGNVGIGTGQPSAKLDVEGTVEINVPAVDQDTVLVFRQDGIARGQIRYDDSEDTFALGYQGYHASQIACANNGNVGIGTTAPNYNLEISADATDDYPFSITNTDKMPIFMFYNDQEGPGAGSGGLFIKDTVKTETVTSIEGRNGKNSYINNGGNVGIGTASPSYKLDVNGTIRGNNVSASDIRLKKNIKAISSPLEKISRIKGVTYEWKDASRDKGRQVGLIAQDVEAVFPELVSADNQGIKALDYAKLVSPLVEAVKALNNENEQLRQENDRIKNRLAKIEELLNSMK